ncbi:MAG: MFS transporter [Ilumatobacteraceae bacterium]
MLNRTVTRVWPDEPETRHRLLTIRNDLVAERGAVGTTTHRDGPRSPSSTCCPVDATFEQASGPFESYERTVTSRHDGLVEQTNFRLRIPWFGWLFVLPVWAHLGRRGRFVSGSGAKPPWWAPPDRIDQRQALVLGLLAAASMSSAFTNTLFTQTAQFAAKDFGIGNLGFSVAGAVVRAGIVVALPFTIFADRVGRAKVMRITAWAAPIVTATGALSPTFPILVVTQAIGRPLGLALDILIAVVVAEEMPRNSRAYAVSVMAMAAGLGAGVAVMALPLADLGAGGWRLVYVVTLIWLVVAVDITRRLPETKRFERAHVIAPRIDRHRLGLLATVAASANFFIAPASVFQNRYLSDVRGFDAGAISLFTLTTATPAGFGLVIGGRLADVRGRKFLIALAVPIATVLLLASFVVDGAPMWAAAFGGGFVGGIALPALSVYRAELFPTGNRGRASGLLTASALLGGSIGLLLVGRLLDLGWSYGQAIGLVALAQIIVVVLVLTRFPETAHRELEDLNPLDREAATVT